VSATRSTVRSGDTPAELDLANCKISIHEPLIAGMKRAFISENCRLDGTVSDVKVRFLRDSDLPEGEEPPGVVWNDGCVVLVSTDGLGLYQDGVKISEAPRRAHDLQFVAQGSYAVAIGSNQRLDFEQAQWFTMPGTLCDISSDGQWGVFNVADTLRTSI
jgi:hypothetical protein